YLVTVTEQNGLLYLPLVWVFWALVNLVINVTEEGLRELVLSRNKDVIGRLQNMAVETTATLNGIRRDYAREWAQACEGYVGYPPDWSQRRAKVLARDGYKCSKCGYPDGFKRKCRELHVHHIVHISDGGDNRPSNLVTLCHICHRNIDTHHGAVRKMRKPSSKELW
ncbi:MAG: HNH endonuclease, partial [Rhodocyclaceae bacterium]|nr:HNH endonuclease [Rhodocyclaceae bacterium]MBX3676396.1 HNH endonuclease [Rhodocyclaceae bacterium]